MKKIVFIIGSGRKNSFNKTLSQVAAKALEGKAEIEVVDVLDVPLLNQDEEFVEMRKEQDNFPKIYPYRNGAGEVDFYRLKLNRVGKAFLEINDFLENNKFYIIDKIF